MAIAKGTVSSIYWCEEDVYGVPQDRRDEIGPPALTGKTYINHPFNNEALDENINTVTGEDIRIDRATAAIRGGNIGTGGTVLHDFGSERSIVWLKHLLADNWYDTSTGGADAEGQLHPGGGPWMTQIYPAAGLIRRGQYGWTTPLPAAQPQPLWVCLSGGTVDTTLTQGDIDAILDDATTEVGERRELSEDGGGPNLVFQKTQHIIPDAVSDPLSILYLHHLRGGRAFPTGGITIEKAILGGEVDVYLQFPGIRFNTLEMTVPQEGIVKATWTALSIRSNNLNESITTPSERPPTQTPVPIAEDPFTGFNSYVQLNDTVGIFGRAHREFTLTFSNQIADDVYVMSDRYRQELPEGIRQINGRISNYFLDETEYAYFKGETKIGLWLSMIHDGNVMIWKMPEVKLTGSGTPKISGPGVLQADYDWTAFLQDAEYDIELYIVTATQLYPSGKTVI